jgi:ABC-2 type transport system permease protein
MVALLISLKLHLLRGSLHRNLSQQIGLAFGVVGGLFATGLAIVGLVALRTVDTLTAEAAVVVAGSVLMLGWAVVPLLISGVDETLDPSRFALLPVRAGRLVPGLLLAGLVGVPGVATSIAALATLVTWSRGALPLIFALPAAVVGTLTCVLASRLTTTAAAGLLATRRFREVGTSIAVLTMAGTGAVPAAVVGLGLGTSDLERTLGVLGWSPFGVAWEVPADAANGHPGRALLRLVVALAVLVVGALAWAALLSRALADRARAGQPTRARVRGSVLDRLPARPMWAVTGRCLRYWRRDPRYLVALGSVLVGSLAPMAAIRAATGQTPGLLAVGPLAGLVAGLSAANDLGYDGSAFAAHLLAGVPGRVDRRGRAVAVLVWGVPLVLAVAVVACLVAGRPDLWPGCVGTSLSALLGGLGVGSLGGALAPFPMPEAGSNPFRTTSGGTARSALAQGVMMSVAVALTVPAGALLAVGVLWWPPASWLAAVVGPVIGAIALRHGTALGGRVVDARGPELLALVRRGA